MKKVKPLKTVPDAFAEIGRTVNELCEVAKPIKAGKGIKLTESNEDIMIAVNQDTFSLEDLVQGQEGDMLYHDGDEWVVLPAPTGMTLDPVLRFNLSTKTPYWEEPSECP